MNEKKRIFFTFFILFLTITAFWFGVLVADNLTIYRFNICKSEEIDFSLFWQAYDKIKENFVSPEKINAEKIIYGAISGMVNSLDDPYTVFFAPEEFKRFEEEVKGEFEGVGMEIGIKKGQLQVISPLEGTPAQRAGLRAGDKILAIDGKLTADLTIDEAVNLIRGPKGTEVTLTIFRDEWEKAKEIKIVRDVIEIPSLKWELKEDIAYIKIYQFSEKLSDDFEKAAFEILKSPAKKIILDLRNNPGGYLDQSEKIAGWFLKKGEIVVIEDYGGKKQNEIHKAKGNEKFSNYPIVVLINEGSASASEILAGALRDNRGVILIGQKTFGKGSVQQLVNLKKGGLKITVAKWLTPKGDLITDKGLEPDIKIEMTEKDYEENKDPQFEKALEIIKNL